MMPDMAGARLASSASVEMAKLIFTIPSSRVVTLRDSMALATPHSASGNSSDTIRPILTSEVRPDLNRWARTRRTRRGPRPVQAGSLSGW